MTGPLSQDPDPAWQAERLAEDRAMSHEATNWAIRQRGLKPTAKIVLWHLCDRHNPDYGCFPTQERLADDCEISRSTLNDHLGQLEAANLLRRVPRLDPVTKRQMPTRYILGFEPGFTPEDGSLPPETGQGALPFEMACDGASSSGTADPDEPIPDVTDGISAPVTHPCPDSGHGNLLRDPCPETAHGSAPKPCPKFTHGPCPENRKSRVRNPDTNLVREPVKEEVRAGAREDISEKFFGELLWALGLAPGATDLPVWWQGWPPREHIRRWRDNLGLSETAIVAVAKATRRDHPAPPDGPKALDRAMERAARQAKQTDQGKPGSSGSDTGTGKSRKPKSWDKPRLSDDELAQFYADLVNSECFLPSSMISNAIRNAMLARGLVTPERLRLRGVP